MNKKLIILMLASLFATHELCVGQTVQKQGWGQWAKEKVSSTIYGIETEPFPAYFEINNVPGNQAISIKHFRGHFTGQIKEISSPEGPRIAGRKRRGKITLVKSKFSRLSQAYDVGDIGEVEKYMPSQNLFGKSPVGFRLSKIIPEAGTKITFNLSQFADLKKELYSSIDFLLNDPSITKEEKSGYRVIKDVLDKLYQLAQKVVGGLGYGTPVIQLDLDEKQTTFRALSDFYYTFALFTNSVIIQKMLTQPVIFKMPPETADSFGEWSHDNKNFLSKHWKWFAGAAAIGTAALAWQNREFLESSFKTAQKTASPYAQAAVGRAYKDITGMGKDVSYVLKAAQKAAPSAYQKALEISRTTAKGIKSDVEGARSYLSPYLSPTYKKALEVGKPAVSRAYKDITGIGKDIYSAGKTAYEAAPSAYQKALEAGKTATETVAQKLYDLGEQTPEISADIAGLGVAGLSSAGILAYLHRSKENKEIKLKEAKTPQEAAATQEELNALEQQIKEAEEQKQAIELKERIERELSELSKDAKKAQKEFREAQTPKKIEQARLKIQEINNLIAQKKKQLIK